jgi:hypothetical protein
VPTPSPWMTETRQVVAERSNQPKQSLDEPSRGNHGKATEERERERRKRLVVGRDRTGQEVARGAGPYMHAAMVHGNVVAANRGEGHKHNWPSAPASQTTQGLIRC